MNHNNDADRYRRPRCYFRKLSTTEALAYPFADRDSARIHTSISSKGRKPVRSFTIIRDGTLVWLSVAGEPTLMRHFENTFKAGTAAASIARNVMRGPGILGVSHALSKDAAAMMLNNALRDFINDDDWHSEA